MSTCNSYVKGNFLIIYIFLFKTPKQRHQNFESELLKKTHAFAFAKHLADHHQEREGDVRALSFKVLKTFKSSLYRQVWEAVKIHGNTATIILNSRSEWHQPLTERVVFTREVREQAPVMAGGGGGGGGGRRREGES